MTLNIMKNPLVLISIVVFAVFVTWFFTKRAYVERFTTNFNPDDQGMEQTIRGYAYQFGDKDSDQSRYFGFPDDINAGFSKMLLPAGPVTQD